VLSAAFKGLLYQYSGSTDLSVGTVIANRDRPELEEMVGPLLNTVALRTDLSGNPSFRALLARERRVATEAYAHQDVPFERIAEELVPVRDRGRSPLFQAMLLLQPAQAPAAGPLEFGLSALDGPGRAATRTDLDLYCFDEGEVLGARLVYPPGLFAAATMARLAERFVRNLADIAADPDRTLDELALDPAAELPVLQPFA
jgi:non-ribosomal peptide synthetase component F